VANFRVPRVYLMQNKPLAERSVLLVEDDIILSTDLAFLLTEAGCKAVVPTTSNAAALSAMVHYIVDVAILDVNIQNEWVFPVANALDAAGIPFLFLTAYSHDSIPAEHRPRPFIQKPHHPDGLVEALVELIEKSQPPTAANDELASNKAR
jgi:two-component SAPR family response regulator